MENSQSKKIFKIEKIIGLLLLIPPVVSIFLFLFNLFSDDAGNIVKMSNLSSKWSGNFNYANGSGGGGYTSAAPIYLGLMAIAGALLLKGSDKNN